MGIYRYEERERLRRVRVLYGGSYEIQLRPRYVSRSADTAPPYTKDKELQPPSQLPAQPTPTTPSTDILKALEDALTLFPGATMIRLIPQVGEGIEITF